MRSRFHFFTPARPAGFTLVELAALFTIIVLLALIFTPQLASYQKTTKLRNETKALAGILRLAAQRAVSEQVVYQVAITSSSTYALINSQTDTTVASTTLDPEITIESVIGLASTTAQFTSTGGAVEAGTIILSNSVNNEISISIKPSGYVQIVE